MKTLSRLVVQMKCIDRSCHLEQHLTHNKHGMNGGD